MPVQGLTIIGESINDSVPSTKKLFDANDLEGLLALAGNQDEKGAAYIDVNVGLRSPAFMAGMIAQIQKVTAKPLSIDTPDAETALAGLNAYDMQRAGGRLPILNSISPLRPQMFELYEIRRYMPLLLISERVVDGRAGTNRTAGETYETAKCMLRMARQRGIENREMIFDPGITPIGMDSEGALGRVLGSLKMIHEDPEFTGAHLSVGLSNFSVMLPSKRADGSPVKAALENAFLTYAMPLGLDMIIGSVVRKYELLPPDHPAMVCLQHGMQKPGFEAIMAVRQFYR